jgi:hypothetical protein
MNIHFKLVIHLVIHFVIHLVIHLDAFLGLLPCSPARCQRYILEMRPALMHVVVVKCSYSSRQRWTISTGGNAHDKDRSTGGTGPAAAAPSPASSAWI